MKKFCDKLQKNQWRITVPNNSMFRKSTSKENGGKSPDRSSKRSSSGFYDFQEAQLEFDKTSDTQAKSLPNSVFHVDSSNSSSENVSEFHDTKENIEMSKSETDMEHFADAEDSQIVKNIDKNNSKFEYDVPRITFKFFEKKGETPEENLYENQSEVTQTYEEPILIKHTIKSELKFTLTSPKSYDSQEENEPCGTSTPKSKDKSSDLSKDDNGDAVVCHPSEKFVSQTEILVRKSYEHIPVILRSGSDPNIVLRETIIDSEEEGFYKVPRSLKIQNRLSQSLSDFDPNEIHSQSDIKNLGRSSNQSSIEHISCSQVNLALKKLKAEKEYRNSLELSENTSDFSKSYKNRLPIKLRRPAVLKSPRKAVESWKEFKTKFNNIMTEQAHQQRVGAFDNKEKVTINFEEMYKNSKTKCKKVFQNTGKIFHKRNKSTDNSECSESNSVATSPNSNQNSEFSFGKTKLRPCDIEYKLNIDKNEKENGADSANNVEIREISENDVPNSETQNKNLKNEEAVLNNVNNHSEKNNIERDKLSPNKSDIGSNNESSLNDEKSSDFDFSNIKNAFKRKLLFLNDEGQNGFEDLRRYVKNGGDFSKELSIILQERAEAEIQYAKHLSKLSSKLSKACREGVGGVNEGWKAVALELEAKSEAHRVCGTALLEETAKPLRNLTESQHRTRKQCESTVEKAARILGDWRAAEAKSKKHSHTCARDNEKLQDAAVIDTTKFGKQTLTKSTNSLMQLAQRQNSVEKENAKLEGKKRKAEDAVKKADIDYYACCVRAERARLDWESAVLRGASTFQTLEEERLNQLKVILDSYLRHNIEIGPRLIEANERLKAPVTQADPTRDLATFQNLRQNSQQASEQLLPDFYCEHVTLAMNRERRKQALIKLLHLIRQDIEREKKSKGGLENLSKAIKQTPSFGAEDSQQTVSEKLYHMKSMLTYLEGARYKVQSALAEMDSRPRTGHPLAPHITVTRDKSGLQQSVLRIPQWLREQFYENEQSPISEKSLKSDNSDNSDPHVNDVDDDNWIGRGAADGNSNQQDSSDFDEFSSQCSSTGHPAEAENVHPIAKCRAIYPYTPNLPDELCLKPGDTLQVYRQQDDGWWLGECNGNVGIFPATYVEIVRS